MITSKCRIDFRQNLQIRSKTGKDQILNIRNSLGTKFQLKLIILNFWTKVTQKRYFQCKKEKKDNNHQILHIQISLSSKFQL